jgi:short-subunit dehydrogenase
MAKEFSRRRAVLVLAARDQRALHEVQNDILLAQPECTKPLIADCDISDRESVHKLATSCRDNLGGIDILINNAGTCIYGETTRSAMDDARAVMEVNFFGSLNCMAAFLPMMTAAGHGLIVNIASVAALHGVPYLAAYGASKAALVAYSESLRAELSGTGVTVMNIYPNYIQTPLFDNEKKLGGAHRPAHNYADAANVARQIAAAIESGRNDLVLSGEGKLLFALRGLVPSWIERQMSRMAERLRDPKGK